MLTGKATEERLHRERRLRAFLAWCGGALDGLLRYVLRTDCFFLSTELLKYHPGLEFLGSTPEFQEKYGKLEARCA